MNSTFPSIRLLSENVSFLILDPRLYAPQLFNVLKSVLVLCLLSFETLAAVLSVFTVFFMQHDGTTSRLPIRLPQVLYLID